jgi:amidophosphoribosyltransferase
LKEKCGVVGVYATNGNDASPSIFYGLYSLQHRGQESCGITVRSKDDFITLKGMGQVPEFFDQEKLESLKGNVGIGHVRYSTTGGSDVENAQPFVITHSKGTMAIAHNGNIVNYDELRDRLEKKGQVFVSTTDTEIIAHLIIKEYIKNDDIIKAIANTMKKLVGSYSLVILTDDKLIAVRDPLGIRPLCIGKRDGEHIVASESVVFDVLNGGFVRDVKPGEIVTINKTGISSDRAINLGRTAHCMFEYVYFARPDSWLNGVSVYNVRETIGGILGEEEDIDFDLVSPIPDSAIPFALGYARKTGVPYREGLIRNRYVGRTFILPGQQARERAVRLKLNPMNHELKGKKVVLFDDSIVRGTTSGRIIQLLKDAGAKEVHMRVGCPPIKRLCKLGIDMPTDKELIASDKTVEEIAKAIGADSLRYLSIEGLKDAIGINNNGLCMGCLTGKYPVELIRPEQVSLEKF